MKRAKDEGKIMGPMFPRLHVNDTEKGGPRAPPRNKMALYEQLSIPSQRFSQTVLPHNRNGAVPYSSQGGGNERGVFSSRHQPPRLMFERQYSQYSDLSSPLTRIQPGKKLDEDDFAVPIFTNSMPSQVNDREKATPFNPSYFNHSLEYSKAAKNGVIGHLPQESVVGQNQFVKAVSNSSIVEKTEEPLKRTYPSSHEPGNSHSNRINLPEFAEVQLASGIHSAISRECTSALTKSKCSISSIAIRSEDQNILHDVANEGESREVGPRLLLQMGNLDRSESVSETLVVDAVFGVDITPDDVVGIIGHSLEYSKAAKNGVIGHLPQESVVGQNQFVKAVSNSSIVEKTEEPLKRTYPSSHEPGNSHSNRINLPEFAEVQPASGIHSAISRECTSALTKSKCSISSIAIRSEDQNILHDVANEGESREVGPRLLLQMGNLDRSESVSETLVVDAVFGVDITPDDVVGIIGQRHFWKARRTITNQQRAFACQVFELHRLIKVQKDMALSRHLLQDVASSDKPIKPAVPTKNLPLDNPDVALPNVSIGESVKPSHKKKLLVQHSVGKPSISAAQTSGNSQATSVSSQYTPPISGALNQTQLHGHQWLIPLMSPSEGLVYKPYPGNSNVFSVYGGYIVPSGSNPGTGSFSTPTFGIPLQHPTFPSPVPQGYFPPYCMPIMTTAFSGSSVEQTNVPSMAHQQTARETNSTIQHDANMDASEDMEAQCSLSTVPIERLQDSGGMKSKHMLPLFPLSPTPTINAAPTSSPHHPQPEHPPARVIKVVPHHSKSASESAARIFRSIQEERSLYDSSM